MGWECTGSVVVSGVLGICGLVQLVCSGGCVWACSVVRVGGCVGASRYIRGVRRDW